jgi:quercetin dioxygenase-like cupin family protein
MKVHSWNEIERESMTTGIERQVVHSQRTTTARIYMKKGAVVARHSHENEQMSHVLEGRLRFEFDGGDIVIGAGEILEIPSHEPHRVVALEDTAAMDVFTPVRQDWISGDDAYLRTPQGES